MKEFALGLVVLGIGIAVFVGIIGGTVYLWQDLKVYSREMSGKATLREAEWSRQVAIEEARAANESATLQAEARIKQETAIAQAEIIRAEGVAESNRIIGEGLKENEQYLRYLWIDKVAGSSNQIIYVPTEAGLPLTEAGKRN
jgi:regulator of protease activity HflC (stomatin/prohibitin superfamily)